MLSNQPRGTRAAVISATGHMRLTPVLVAKPETYEATAHSERRCTQKRAQDYHDPEHFPEKWTPVFREKMRPLKKS